MLGLKLAVVAAAFVGLVVATPEDPPICSTAPAATTTVTVTECAGQPTSLPESSGSGPQPTETSWAVAPTPVSVDPASSVSIPGPSSAASTPAGPHSGPSLPISGSNTGAPPASSSYGTELASSTASDTRPVPSHSAHLDDPSSANAAPLPTAFPGMGSLMAAGAAINVAIAVFG